MVPRLDFRSQCELACDALRNSLSNLESPVYMSKINEREPPSDLLGHTSLARTLKTAATQTALQDTSGSTS